jgi:transcriptional regulator with XRE-family HTH domain
MTAGRRSELARRRRTLGLSQKALAEGMREDARSVGRWERGEAEPQPWQRPGLAKPLNTTLEELDWYLRRDEPNPHDAEAADGRALQPAPPALGVLGAGEVRLHMSTSGDLLAQLDRRVKGHLDILVDGPGFSVLATGRSPCWWPVDSALVATSSPGRCRATSL